MDSTSGHLLALKVMRVSRPTLAGQWQPFEDDSPYFDAYNAANVTSLQRTPRPEAIPSTVRDYTAISPLLSLPGAFGSISLGETFASCLCVTNETKFDIEGVQLRVEMQSSTTKVLLIELGGPQQRLSPSDTLEAIVQSEIKELGQHTLSCSVHYRVPPNLRPPLPSDDPSDPRAQVFRKHYRFPVSNPFSVKTKVHVPKAAAALLSRIEREKVFLEVHIQNLTQEPMWFERLKFEAVDGWASVDGNLTDSSLRKEDDPSSDTIFSGVGSLMQPQDIRQYVYILAPSVLPSFASKPTPGSVIPLGRLDIAWRSTFGEPGRLLTSMLSRRVPAAPVSPIHAPSALPLHVQRALAQSPRPRSPTPSNVSAPTSRSSSPVPYKSRQQRTPIPPASLPDAPPLASTDIEVDLTIDEISNKEHISLHTPFSITFTATLAAPLHSTDKSRTVRIGVQHTLPRRTITAAQPVVPTKRTHSPALSVTPILSNEIHDSPRGHAKSNHPFPSPYTTSSEPTGKGKGRVDFVGSSSLVLPLYTFTSESPQTTNAKHIASHSFTFTYLPTKPGFTSIGGLRLLLVSDTAGVDEVQILHEWPIITDIWVQP